VSKKEQPKPEEVLEEEPIEEQPVEEQPVVEEMPEQEPETSELDTLKADMAKEHELYLRLAAEYDNFRKRSQKEKDNIYRDAQADTVGKFLPVFDNLERAAQQPTEDEAYKKGVEMTLTGLREVMKNLGVEEFGEAGEPFDPNRHNAVMHIERDDLGESVIAQVFQKGFSVGDRVIRFAMVQVAN
jgi:molecular chaperone GrpE